MLPLSNRPGLGTSTRIAGGFVPIPVGALARAWRACRAKPLRIGDFRAWLASREMATRRSMNGQGRAPEFGMDELATLLGVSARTAAASARRLVDAGLLAWAPEAIAFPDDHGPGDHALSQSIGGGRGHIAVPRRLLRFLAKGQRAAIIATAIAILLRCLSRRRRGFQSNGRLKASWVANVFQIDLRAIKAARKQLLRIQWIASEPSPQRVENRWGRTYRIDLGWAPPAAPAEPGPDVADRHPPTPQTCRRSPPPLDDQYPLREEGRDQEPAPGGMAGVEEGGEERRPEAAPAKRPARGDDAARPAALPRPRLADIRPEDLGDSGRLLELHREATARGLVGSSDADRLKFVAAAEHARSVGKGNPCGLFARLVWSGRWDFATHLEEDRAARRLKEHLMGPASASGKGPKMVSAPSSGSVRRVLVACRGPGAAPAGPSSLGEVMARLGLGGLGPT